ncbi:MAG: glycosyltransferase [Acidobacteria bacterium]|nr:glycosyltransferase [Acidobacteriota bacterium]
MRVLQVFPRISPESGGPSSLTAFARCLTQHGVETTVATTDAGLTGQDVPLNRPVTRDGATYVFHKVLPAAGRWRLAPSFVTTLARTIASYDLVHIHWLYDFVCLAAARAAVAAGVPFVLQPHGSLDPHLRRKNRLVKAVYLATIGRPLLTRAAALVFTSEQERELSAYGPRRPEWVIPAALDWADFERLPPPGAFRHACPQVEGPFLLFLGRVSAQKGLDLLLPAFARIAPHHPALRLVVAGPDYRGYTAEVRALARRFSLEHRVHVTGMLTPALKLAALVDAERLVLPSYAENFGLVVTEALSCGLPVVMSDQVNIHREIAAAGAATIVQCTVESVARGIESSLADTGLRGRIAALGPALVRGHYTWDAVMPMVLDRYRDVTHG